MLVQSSGLALFAAVMPTLVLGCGDGDSDEEEPSTFDTYRMCWDEHHASEHFSTPQSISICCLMWPIGNQPANELCGDTAASCETYVDANLGSADVTADDVATGCIDYITQRGM